MNQEFLNDFILQLKKVEYPGVIQDLQLEYDYDRENIPYIKLICIKIRKEFKNKGYGTKILEDIIELANQYDLRIKLFATNIFGSNLDRLIKFYERFGFVLVDNDNNMVYNPNQK